MVIDAGGYDYGSGGVVVGIEAATGGHGRNDDLVGFGEFALHAHDQLLGQYRRAICRIDVVAIAFSEDFALPRMGVQHRVF